MSNITLVSPIKGWVAPLDEVPDPVFAERLLGDGLAIDPTGATVHAPCDGVIITVARHAVTLRAPNGAEILIHVGLETVALHGQGFVTHVREGASVRTGEPLITFDLDFLAGRAKSLISPVVVVNGSDFAIVRRSTGRETGIGEFLMELRALSEPETAAPAEASRDVAVRLTHGIHARPAAMIASAAKPFDSQIELSLKGRRVNARSVAALMSLGVAKGDTVTIVARGADSHAAVRVLSELIAHGIKEAPEAPAPKPPAAKPSDEPGVLSGICGAPGLAVGAAFQLRKHDIEVMEAGRGIAHETAALSGALTAVRARIEALSSEGTRQRREILGAHLALLDDPEILARAQLSIDGGKSAAFAWREALSVYGAALRESPDARMRERAGDVADLERQVLSTLLGVHGTAAPPPGCIVIADELLPSDLAAFAEIAGFATAQGGPTSHVAILAASMGLPALVGIGAGVLDVADGAAVILDADTGRLHAAPSQDALAQARLTIERSHVSQLAALSRAQALCRMADGTRIEILANLGAGAEEAAAAVAAGAEGCGLLRTEFLFHDRDAPPGEDEQAKIYQAITNALDGRPLKIRTFDIGGDKPVSYLSLQPEENPALGLRGIRLALWRKDLLEAQLAAILRVRPMPRIMLPMVASASELCEVRTMLDGLRLARGIADPVSLGIMVETPASAVLSAQLAADADFFSIGTNDLTQYALAMDRTNAQLGRQVDAFHPAVLALIAQAVTGAAAHARPVGVCGGLASDPLAAAILIGLGVRELSMPKGAIARVKDIVGRLDLAACRAAAAQALKQNSAQAVREIAAKALPGSVA